MTSRTLISISDFANVGPEDTVYPPAYKLKSCTLCSEEATKIVLYSVSDNIIAQERYCDRHAKMIKKHYDAGFQAVAEAFAFEDKDIE
jgi:hypothetical protein